MARTCNLRSQSHLSVSEKKFQSSTYSSIGRVTTTCCKFFKCPSNLRITSSTEKLSLPSFFLFLRPPNNNNGDLFSAIPCDSSFASSFKGHLGAFLILLSNQSSFVLSVQNMDQTVFVFFVCSIVFLQWFVFALLSSCSGLFALLSSCNGLFALLSSCNGLFLLYCLLAMVCLLYCLLAMACWDKTDVCLWFAFDWANEKSLPWKRR